MRKILLFLMVVFFVSCQTKSTINTKKFSVKKGTNVAHWLSQSKSRGSERMIFFTKSDVDSIAAMGFDHIRLPIDEEQMWNEKGERHEDAFELMTSCIDWCIEKNLRVIVDLHILRSHHFNAKEKPLWTNPAEQEKFYNLWVDLSKALINYPNSMVAYELMNEAVADDPELWNNLLANALQVIRKTEPERTIVIGSNRWQQVQTFDELKIPEGDKNIILSFHFYEPLLLTHWNASWNYLKGYTGPVNYPDTILTQSEYDQLPEEMKTQVANWKGQVFNKVWIRKQWQKPIQKSKELGLPLYCGEFGVITGPPLEDMLRWYKDMIDLFEENGIGYANWNYKSDDFGLLDKNRDKRNEIISIVSGNQQIK